MRLFFCLVFLTLSTQCGFAAENLYFNARFGFSAAIPMILAFDKSESDNGDGATFHSQDGSAELRLWGSRLLERNLAAEARIRLLNDRQDGWVVTYTGGKFAQKFAVFSGRKDGRIMYQRLISACAGRVAAYYRLEYPAADKLIYDAAIASLNATLKAAKGSCS